MPSLAYPRRALDDPARSCLAEPNQALPSRTPADRTVNQIAVFLGRPPNFPFLRAAAVFFSDLTLPPLDARHIGQYEISFAL